MHRPLSAATLVASLLACLGPMVAEGSEALERSGALLARDDGRAAVPLLEAALPTASSAERSALLQQLRRAYEVAARQAEAAGQVGEAEAYRDNLRILDRKGPAPAVPGRATLDPGRAPVVDPSPTPPPPALPPGRPDIVGVADPPRPGPTEPREPAAEVPPGPRAEAPAPEPVEPILAGLEAADAAFSARRYEEAGKAYADLARAGRLPDSRRDHWVYCRCAGVVRRINANPRTAEDWAKIQAEIRQIRELSPHHWFGEYLRRLAAERSAGAGRPEARPVVVRGSAPEEAPAPAQSPPPRRPGPQAKAGPTTSTTPEPASRPGPAAGNWQVLTTPNFRILHADAALAGRVARAAEAAREEQIRHWTGSTPGAAWSPKCDLYLYPDASTFSRMTGQPEDSPGFSTMGMNSGRVVTRRVNLRADHPNLVAAILPHEVTHVVLADLFPTKQIPRWADEGMAVLSEPATEQDDRSADLAEPLAAGRLFRVEDLMKMDYPDGKHWALYYAQSVSLTRFLVEQGSPAQFIRFLKASQNGNPEAQLRQVYKIDGFADLQRRWLAYARSSPAVATSSADRTANDGTARR